MLYNFHITIPNGMNKSSLCRQKYNPWGKILILILSLCRFFFLPCKFSSRLIVVKLLLLGTNQTKNYITRNLISTFIL